MGRAPEEEKSNATFEYEMWGGEYIKKFVEAGNVINNRK